MQRKTTSGLWIKLKRVDEYLGQIDNKDVRSRKKIRDQRTREQDKTNSRKENPKTRRVEQN